MLDGTCSELATYLCIDRGCEDGPDGPGGWKAACCGGYAFEWAGGDLPSKSCVLFVYSVCLFSLFLSFHNVSLSLFPFSRLFLFFHILSSHFQICKEASISLWTANII